MRVTLVRAVILLGTVYFVIGYGSATLDPSVPDQMRFMWRLAAWVATGAVYAAHIGYEQLWLGNSPRTTAGHVAMAVALGALLLAIAATVHAVMVQTHAPYWRFLLALVVLPIISATPAFLVALVTGTVLGRLRRRA